jgi:glutamate racemase
VGIVGATNGRDDDPPAEDGPRPSSVGLFDSGWGGLSVALAIRAELPGQDLVYVGDHAWCPYGGRDAATIRTRSVALARRLAGRGCRAIVAACNTASSLALDDVRAAVPGVPVVGVVPAVKPAAAGSRAGRIAVLATPATAAGSYLSRLVADHAPGIHVRVVPAPGLVDLVERGETDGPTVEGALRSLLGPSLAAGADAVVLGCTHYPFLRPAIERVCGPGVAVIDSGEAIARRVRDVLGEGVASSDASARFDLLTTGNRDAVAPTAGRLLGRSVRVVGIDA